VDVAGARVVLDGHETLVRVYPISVESEPLREAADSARARHRSGEMAAQIGDERLILRVDRLELTKNIVRGFRAYEEFLRRNPRWRGKVRFLALLSPSREELREYREYAEECASEAERINARFGDGGWMPIHLRIRDDHVGAIAAYGLYDVLLVNPVYDGMNLVAMEGPLLNRHNGVLILSRNAGAHSRLGRYALGVNPFDIGEVAGALERALEMPMHERARRARGLTRLVLANPPSRWVGSQLEDLRRARERRGR
jgi:trehalose 6-phosphate synthase